MRKRIHPREGARYGQLVCVSETEDAQIGIWLCACGKRLRLPYSDVRKGYTSCGCGKRARGAARMRDLNAHKAKDLTGQTIKHLRVLHRAGSDDRGHALWLCQCVCGFRGVYRGKDLRAGGVGSCGCAKQPTLVGQTFGCLVVLNQLPSQRGRRVWECLCSCGSRLTLSSERLRVRKQVCSCRSPLAPDPCAVGVPHLPVPPTATTRESL